MRRIAITIGLLGLLAGCGQQAGAPGEGGAPGQTLDYIDAVPITEDEPAPVAQPEAPAKTEEPKEDRAEAEKAEAETKTAPTPTAPTPEPATPSSDAATATRRANEAVAPRSSTEVPYSPN